MARWAIFILLIVTMAAVASADPWDVYYVEVSAETAAERGIAADLGMDIHAVLPGSVLGFASQRAIDEMVLEGLYVTYRPLPPRAPGATDGFPGYDQLYHDYAEMVALLEQWAADYPDILHLYSIGQSIEGHALWTVKISDNVTDDESASEPGIVIVGQHHAREHISREVPLGLIDYLVETYDILYSTTTLVDSREIWITPALNPDGAEYDITGGSYHYWRKNRRDNPDSECWGVDPNRNYGYMWGQSGSSPYECDETYRGAYAFSEPETAMFRDHVESHSNIDILLTYHNYSELLLYPWGYTYDSIPSGDRARHVALGEVYVSFNGYTLQQASDLYPTSGDTCDWSYGELGITSFTVELSPDSWGDFYLPDEQIERVIGENLPGMLYMISEAGSTSTASQSERIRQILADLSEFKEWRAESLLAPPAASLDERDLACGMIRVTSDGDVLVASLVMALLVVVPVLILILRRRKRR